MNKAPIAKIKAELKSMYPGYRFDMKAIQSNYSYMITAFRDTETLGSISIAADTPMTEFWETVKTWMRSIL